ncbi:pentapeptide repeat-containing protein [Streptomyces sp. NPDC006733]|uniref:pentapeptide repeat-containing protein n=1 Tax=Streptomyces sp. NPDC006733 TaxID=3155460 RepID=UPI0033F22469
MDPPEELGGLLVSLATLTAVGAALITVRQAASEQNLTRDGQVTNRHTAAVTNLGDNAEEVRIGVRVDLTAADLTGAFLFSADVTGAKLADADLTDAMLNGADLSKAKGYTPSTPRPQKPIPPPAH